MLAVQKILESTDLDTLAAALGLRVTHHPTDPLVILNYDMVESPKRDPITQECRGLVLEKGTWRVVARAFPRFFNAGECPDLEAKFDWSCCMSESKEDGSLILLYYYGHWRVNTRGSFGQGEVQPGCGHTWQSLFRSTISWFNVNQLDPRYTYVFELCSPLNKVVRKYPSPQSFLLTAFHNGSGVEMNEVALDNVARDLHCKRPLRYIFASAKEVVEFLEAHEDPTFEGVVVRDRHGRRLKVKNSRYVALHHLHDNGNVARPDRILHIVLTGEGSEALTYLSEEVEGPFYDMTERLYGQFGRMLAVWDRAKGLASQKEFALYVKKWTPLAAVLFAARKNKTDPKYEFLKSEALILKTLEGK